MDLRFGELTATIARCSLGRRATPVGCCNVCRREIPRYRHRALDIRQREELLAFVDELRPDLIVHAAAQPSHDRAAAIPFLDFEVNAMGTLHMLEAARRSCPESPFIHMSTNKVYGDRPNTIALEEQETRFDYADPAFQNGIPEDPFHRPEQAFPVRRLQGRRGYYGAGIRTLFQHADLLFARRLPDRPQSCRRGAARFPELSHQVQPRGP